MEAGRYERERTQTLVSTRLLLVKYTLFNGGLPVPGAGFPSSQLLKGLSSMVCACFSLSTRLRYAALGGYCKEYSKGKRPVGVMLEDTWFLKRVDLLEVSFPCPSQPLLVSRMSLNPEADHKADPLIVKWERRKRPSTAFAPSLRSGCTMGLWAAKSMGIMFGGVTDEDKHEETLESVFHNDLYGYQLSGNGRWVSMLLKKPKQEKGKKKKPVQSVPVVRGAEREGSDCEGDEDEDEVRNPTSFSLCGGLRS